VSSSRRTSHRVAAFSRGSQFVYFVSYSRLLFYERLRVRRGSTEYADGKRRKQTRPRVIASDSGLKKSDVAKPEEPHRAFCGSAGVSRAQACRDGRYISDLEVD